MRKKVLQSSSPLRLQYSAGPLPQRLWFRPATVGSLCPRLARPMFNRFAIGITVIGGITVTADGATIIAARGGTAIAVMAITDLRLRIYGWGGGHHHHHHGHH